jgi:WD repeat-containing protein 19
MNSNATITNLAWDKDGDYLAILQEGSGVVPLWSSSTKRVVPLETSLKDPTFLAWSKTGPQLAIGTLKGNLLIYNKTKKQKVPIIGKHAKRITCGSWSAGGNKLVLGSDDRTLTISNDAGDTLIHTELKYSPLETNFTCASKRHSEDDTVSANLGGKSLLLFNILDENEDPMELTFAQGTGGKCKYGDLVSHQWCDDGTLMIGFSDGWLIVVSTNPSEIGDEKYSGKIHRSLVNFSYNKGLQRVASAGSDGVRILDSKDFKEIRSDYISTEDLEDGRVTDTRWSPDGQILTISTAAGNVYNFLAKMSALYAQYKSTIAYLSSLREVSVVDVAGRGKPVDITLRLEPSIIAIGEKHVAAGMNNFVYYHRIEPKNDPMMSSEREYMGTVQQVCLNDKFAAVMVDNKVVLHTIEQNGDQKQSKTFPSREEGSFAVITTIALTDDFLIYGTEAGSVEIFFLQEWVLLAGAELRLDSSIRKLYPNGDGTRIVVIDSANNIHLFNPVTGGGVNQSITRFEDSPSNVTKVLWDMEEHNTIMVFDGCVAHTYLYVPVSIKGPILTKLGPVTVSKDGEVTLNPEKVEIEGGNIPIVSIGGVFTCQLGSGALSSITHPYFNTLPDSSRSRRDQDNSPESLKYRFCQALALLKLEAAWLAALELDERKYWLALSGKAMEMLNVELASRVYRQLGDGGMVSALQQCQHIEDRHLLAGYISLLFCDYARAQDLFLASSRPIAALDMRKDLLHWDQALKLAQTLAQNQVPEVCIRFGHQLEFRDQIESALRMYETALNTSESDNIAIPEKLLNMAMMGISRCNLRQGDMRRGMRLANEIDSRPLFEDCGDILETQKQYSDAANMYLKAQQFDRAGSMFTRYLIKTDSGRIDEASEIMAKVSNDNLNSAFAKLCVLAGRHDVAVVAYRRAKDMDKVVELNLRHLDNVQGAFDLVRETASAQGAQLVADYCVDHNDFRGAIEFLLIANKSDEAFKIAQTNGIVEIYTNILGDTICAEDALRVAHFYEKAQDNGKAGKFYAMCGQYSRALKLFIQCGDREIDAAIDVVGKSQNETLTSQLIDFLVGEKDGVPKDPNYIYRLYMALKKFDDAAKTAMIIARQEQDMGNYPLAHSVIVETTQQLELNEIRVPLQLRNLFVLLHSYQLVKTLVKRDDHLGAARILLRVVQNVSKFPMHVVPILMSTVVECRRAGLNASAYEHAVTLMRPEHRPNINADLKRKIEAIVRRKNSGESEPEEESSPCPISGEMIHITNLECPTTRDALPMCIVTGRHMVVSDWCFCPTTKFPALYSEYVKYIKAELATGASAAGTGAEGSTPTGGATDPLTGKPVFLADLKLATAEEAAKYIQRYNNVAPEKKEEEKPEDDVEDGAEAKEGSPAKGKSESKGDSKLVN